MIIKVYASQAEIIKRLIIGYLISYDYNKPSNTLEIGFDFTILDIIVPYLTSNNIQFKLLNADDYSNTCCALYTQSPLSISAIIFLSKLHLLAKST